MGDRAVLQGLLGCKAQGPRDMGEQDRLGEERETGSAEKSVPAKALVLGLQYSSRAGWPLSPGTTDPLSQWGHAVQHQVRSDLGGPGEPAAPPGFPQARTVP